MQCCSLCFSCFPPQGGPAKSSWPRYWNEWEICDSFHRKFLCRLKKSLTFVLKQICRSCLYCFLILTNGLLPKKNFGCVCMFNNNKDNVRNVWLGFCVHFFIWTHHLISMFISSGLMLMKLLQTLQMDYIWANGLTLFGQIANLTNDLKCGSC